MAGDFRLGLANGAAMITGVAMITGRVAMMDVAAADSRWRSFPLRGPLPFSGANAALGYLPLQLALHSEGKSQCRPRLSATATCFAARNKNTDDS